MSAITTWVHDLCRYAGHRWAHLTPGEYGTLLIFVAVVGVVMMKNGTR